MSDDFEPHYLDERLLDDDWVSTPNVVRTDKTMVVKDIFLAGDHEIELLRGLRMVRKATAVHYTTAADDFIIAVTSVASTAISIGLPLPRVARIGKVYVVKDESGGAATTTITIRSDGEKTIDGAASLSISSNYGVSRLYSDGSNWFTF